MNKVLVILLLFLPLANANGHGKKENNQVEVPSLATPLPTYPRDEKILSIKEIAELNEKSNEEISEVLKEESLNEEEIKKIIKDSEIVVESFLTGFSFSMIETGFGIATNVFKSEDIRTLWDRVYTYTSLASICIAAIGGGLEIADYTDAGEITAVTGLSITGLFFVIDNFKKPKNSSRIQAATISLAVARQGYEDLLIRNNEYQDIIKEFQAIEIELKDYNSQLSYDGINLTDDEVVKKIVLLSNRMVRVASSARDLLLQMKNQSLVYLEITKESSIYNSEIKNWINQYEELINKIKNLIKRYDSTVNIRLNALSLFLQSRGILILH